LYQGTTLVVPQMQQNEYWALAPAEGFDQSGKELQEELSTGQFYLR
jgi:hypothetical protein